MRLTSPGPTLGVVGGGQLGRMLGEAAGPLGVSVVVSDPTPDCPASPVVADQLVGDFDDYGTLRALAERADVLTYEIELADPDTLAAVSEETGTPVHPTPDTLRTIQDKLVQNERFDDAGVPLPDYRRVDDAEDLRDAGDDLGWPVMLKARTGGYDGRGNVPVANPEDAEAALAEVGAGEGGALAERMVDFDREMAIIGVRGADGETDAFPVTETIHEDEIMRETVSPARTDGAVRERAREVALDVLDALEGRGVFGIELFERSSRSDDGRSSGHRPRAGGEILLNEVAPRPHNSGHWTIEGAVTSQFEQHVRAVLGLPLGSTERRCPTVMANVLGDVQEPTRAELTGVEDLLAADGTHLHWYGKREVRPLRKMGHVTLTADGAGTRDVEELLERVAERRDDLTFA
ncbi:5-(carboxyamino)imidazole ribonucleotide synthase [Halosegnis marinus]|uniref:N5-carboxyaminoimidazole ribonucleotide synthase n=1 Tax=Halosegnis marinus TaxID=3034023 RepID=A0ABD5ZQV9_9EURY|nr:5-(carboxyamino)imidazole ribonucleotide synthase [Halosegnis sp. DT85]